MTNQRRNSLLETVSTGSTNSSSRHLNHRTRSSGFCDHGRAGLASYEPSTSHQPSHMNAHSTTPARITSNALSARRSNDRTQSGFSLSCPSRVPPMHCRSSGHKLPHASHPSSKMNSLLYISLFLIVSNAFQLVICRQVSGEHSKYQGESKILA